MAIGTLGLWIWPIIFLILYLGSLRVYFKFYRPWYTCLKAFLKLESAFKGFLSVCHIYSILDSASLVTGNFRSLCIVYASLFGSQVFVNIVFETVFTTYEYAKEEEAYNKFLLIVRCIIIIIFFELPTLCFQALAMKKFANLKLSDTIENHNWYTTTEGPDPYFMRWSELGWDFSMQLQFMFQFILFSMIDLNFYFGTFKKKSGLLLLALCAYFTLVYLIQVGGV